MTILTKERLHGIVITEAGTGANDYGLFDIAKSQNINLADFSPIGIRGQILGKSNSDKVNKDDNRVYYGIHLTLMLIETEKYNKLIKNKLTQEEINKLEYHSCPILENGDVNDLVKKLTNFSFILSEKSDIEPLNIIFKDSGLNLYQIPGKNKSELTSSN